MSLSNIFPRILVFLRKISIRRKKVNSLDFTHVSEHMRRDLGYYNSDGAHRIRDQHHKPHNPFLRGP